MSVLLEHSAATAAFSRAAGGRFMAERRQMATAGGRKKPQQDLHGNQRPYG